MGGMVDELVLSRDMLYILAVVNGLYFPPSKLDTVRSDQIKSGIVVVTNTSGRSYSSPNYE